MKKLKTLWENKNKDQQVFWLAMAAVAVAVILLL